jgi:hypothetical protein
MKSRKLVAITKAVGITIGKHYSERSNSINSFLIKNDLGELTWYDRNNFNDLHIERNRKLKELLG